ncbi:MAG: response regulator [Gammaproteobacteria bacterium]|nr:response regulator [Gammaproteobacteria bacterium]
MTELDQFELVSPSDKSVESAGTVLLVDDDVALRSALRSILDMRDYEVLEADGRRAALELLGEHGEIGVIVLDLGMPPAEHSTEEGLAVIRAVSASMHPAKIIVLTGQDEESSALDAIREGAFDFLSKPARSQDILSAVRRALLFHRNEQAMASEGMTRLQINAKVADGLKAVREEAEEKLVRQVLKDTDFNVYQSAARLGLKRESIYYFLKKFEIKRDDN